MPRKKATSYALVLFQSGPQFPLITRPAVSHIQQMLDGVITTPKDATEIDIWLDSPGGDAHATYKLILDLRQRCRLLRAVIPDYAKSAATLLCLGVDTIFMAPSADLGPLDVQLAHPDREDHQISGLDLAGSLDYLSDLALNLAIAGGASVIRYTKLPRAEVLKSMLEFSARFLRPCVEKVDPHLTRRAVFQLKVAEKYAVSMLEMRQVPEENRLTAECALAMVTKLVKDYPVHEFVISRDEAKSLGLPVEFAENHPNWNLIKREHATFMTNDQTVIRAMRMKMPKSEKKEKAKSQGAKGEKTDGKTAEAKKTNGKAMPDVAPELTGKSIPSTVSARGVSR